MSEKLTIGDLYNYTEKESNLDYYFVPIEIEAALGQKLIDLNLWTKERTIDVYKILVLNKKTKRTEKTVMIVTSSNLKFITKL